MVSLAEGVDNLYSEITAETDEHTAVVRISKMTIRQPMFAVDGEIVSETINESQKAAKTEYAMTFDSILRISSKTADISGIIPQIKQQLEYTTAISREGLSNDYGSNIGQLLLLDEENPSL